MKYILIVVTLFFIQVTVYSQQKEAEQFFEESKRIQKGINWIILKSGDTIAHSCENAVLYFIFIQNMKKTKFRLAGDDPRITGMINIEANDSVSVNWSMIDAKIKDQMIFQPVVIKCQGKEDKDIFVSVNSFNAIFAVSQENRKNKITLLEPMIIDVGIPVR